MKSLKDYLFERYNPKTTLHFSNDSAACMYEFEMRGQISDGKYENARPYNHWEWVLNEDIIVDGNEYYECTSQRRKKYNLNEWINPIKEFLNNGEYSWEVRLYFYGKLGKIFKFDETMEKNYDSYRSLAELYGDSQHEGKKFDEIKIRDYQKRHIDSVGKYFSEENYDKFCNTEYSLKEFLDDVKSMEKTINTFKK